MGHRRQRLRISCLVLTLTAAAVSTDADAGLETATAAREDYERLQEWNFETASWPLPPGGVRWSAGSADFELVEGTVRLARPTSTEAVTGFVFEGRGSVRVEVEDPIELRQLGRFMEADVEAFEATFTELVARGNDLGFLTTSESSSASSHRVDPLARERHDHWLRIRRHDADARVIAALASPGDRYLRADFKTAEHGWVTFDFDAARHEELHLSVFRKRNSVVEHWLSLDVEADGVAPGSVELEHFDCSVRMFKTGKDALNFKTGHVKLLGEFTVVSRFKAGHSGDRAVRLTLHPMAKVLEVRDAKGRTLPVLRDHLGARSRHIDKRIHDGNLVVLLAEPTEAGEILELVFEYELEVANYVPGRSWYPTGDVLERGLRNRHTAVLDVEIRKDFDIRAMGKLEEDSVEGPSRRARWRVEKPAKMITFSTTRKMEEHTIEVEGGPNVVVFGPPVGGGRLPAMGADIAESISFFQELYDEPLPNEALYATLIQAGHGQAFDGFLHLTENSSYRPNQTGVVERFLAHEVAHEWWGHMVGWSSYRDQWLSEGLAEYAAMMYIEAKLPRGGKIFQEIVTAYRDELIGSRASALSQFTSQRSVEDIAMARARIGPIALGFRAATAEAPGAYRSQTYHKGALVAHMLRGTLSDPADGDAVFRKVMRGFVERFKDGTASTADLAEEVGRHAPGDWAWFFEQWINRAEIPTYRWSARIGSQPEADGGYPVELTVRREDVSDDFRMLVPVEVEFGDAQKTRVMVDVDEDTESYSLLFPDRPRKVTFNPEAAVLARTERSKK